MCKCSSWVWPGHSQLCPDKNETFMVGWYSPSISGQPAPMFSRLMVKKLLPISSHNLSYFNLWQVSHFPDTYLCEVPKFLKNLLTGTEMLLLCLHTKPPLLKKPSSITLSLVASVWAQFSLGAPCSISSGLSMSLPHYGLQNWIQYSKRGLASAKQEQTTTSITANSRRSWRGNLSCCQNTAGLSPAWFPQSFPSELLPQQLVPILSQVQEVHLCCL